MTDPSLTGVWRADPSDAEGRRRFGDTTLDVRPDGSLIYMSHGQMKDQISLLTYRVVAPGWIETDQPSSPRAERTGYAICGRRLTLISDGDAVSYLRVD